jgi:predicted ATPase with chaperone activity
MLPALSVAKALETTGRHSVGGLTSARTVLVTARPYRAPPQTIAHVGLIGGGHIPMPGEVSLAPHGMLFRDEQLAFRCYCLITIAYRRLVSSLSAVLSCVTRTTRPVAMVCTSN